MVPGLVNPDANMDLKQRVSFFRAQTHRCLLLLCGYFCAATYSD